MKRLTIALAAACTLASSAVAQTAVPDMRGTWIGTSESIVLGNTKHHAPVGAHAPLLDNVEFTYVITNQDGHRFWGTLVSARSKEPLIGVIGLDGKTVVARTSEGEVRGTLVDGDTIEHIYSAGGNGRVLAVNTMKRKK